MSHLHLTSNWHISKMVNDLAINPHSEVYMLFSQLLQCRTVVPMCKRWQNLCENTWSLCQRTFCTAALPCDTFPMSPVPATGKDRCPCGYVHRWHIYMFTLSSRLHFLAHKESLRWTGTSSGDLFSLKMCPWLWGINLSLDLTKTEYPFLYPEVVRLVTCNKNVI